MTQLEDFAALAQSGQELSRETLFPAEILVDGTETVLPCSGGSLRENEKQFVAGGFLEDFEITFRVRRELVTEIPLEVSATKFQWRRAGETEWRGRVLLLQIADGNGGTTYLLQGNSVSK